MPATGSGRDAIHGPAPDDCPAPRSRATGPWAWYRRSRHLRLHRRGQDRTGLPRTSPELWHGLAGLALAGCQGLLGAAVSPHLASESCPDFFESSRSSWSPVTESNRRPSPYHACRFRLMASGWVGLPQVRGIAVSEYVALRLPLPGAVVTWFVTGSRILLPFKMHDRGAWRAQRAA